MKNAPLSTIQDVDKPRLPIEVYEGVIEAVYDDRYYQAPIALATLSSCALVCRAWRPRAQRVLFEYVTLRDKAALYSFAALLDASPELGSYVRTLDLRGHLHVPYSPAVLFPAALRGKLTGLQELHMYGFNEEEKAENPLPEGEKELPTLPIHRHFPALLARSMSHICRLDLLDVSFPSFGDFARMLDVLPKLEALFCQEVSWTVLGQDPLCMARNRPCNSPKTFLPELRTLECYNMDQEGRQRLISSLGPSLRSLSLQFPHRQTFVYSEEEEKSPDRENAAPIALHDRSFPKLHRLTFHLTPFGQNIGATLESLRDTAASWMASGEWRSGHGDASAQKRSLYIRPYRYRFTRAQFVELLRAVGPIVEAVLCRKDSTAADVDNDYNTSGQESENHGNPCLVRLVVEAIGDRAEWRTWWRANIKECFPTFAKWRRLSIRTSKSLYPEECWKDYDRTPQDPAEDTPSPQPGLDESAAQEPDAHKH